MGDVFDLRQARKQAARAMQAHRAAVNQLLHEVGNLACSGGVARKVKSAATPIGTG